MNTIKTLCFVIAALSSYAALAYRLCQVRRSRRENAYRTLVITLLLQCLTFTMGAIAMGGGSFLGVGNLAILVMHVSAVAFCVSAQIILLRWATTAEEAVRRTRYWLVTGIALNALLTALFFIADGPGRPASDFSTGSGQPLVLIYLLVFIVSQALPCVTIFRQCGPYARMASKASLRQALRMLSVAAVILFLYCLARTVNILTAACGIDIGVWQLAASVFSAVGIVVLSLSLTISSWGASAAKLLRWARSYRSYRALYPLWRDLYESSPDIVLEPPGASVSDLDYRLHRRVIEIRDGWRGLRPYIDRSAHGADGAGPGASDESRQAFAEAAQIKQALRAKRAGTIPDDNKDAGDFEDHDTDNFTAEVAWLTRVASAYRGLERHENVG
ncbi:Syd protein [Streptomyces sp. NBRC 110611]|uniref:MAB_1171c family putative transporter n=1 Tax=Streptomyces sp. NBRC 110611 TaxID=1621259 RepID=UPI0008362579|nr:MAB_1171c family putative transporter [Streptomyces sp. NBRC 110611]GAU69651.1 Syd protein [Streptomyces sp. NBRC 110611]